MRQLAVSMTRFGGPSEQGSAHLSAEFEKHGGANFSRFQRDFFADLFRSNLATRKERVSRKIQTLSEFESKRERGGLTKVMCLIRASPVRASTLSGSVTAI